MELLLMNFYNAIFVFTSSFGRWEQTRKALCMVYKCYNVNKNIIKFKRKKKEKTEKDEELYFQTNRYRKKTYIRPYWTK